MKGGFKAPFVLYTYKPGETATGANNVEYYNRIYAMSVKFYIHVFLIILATLIYFISNFHRVAVPGAVFSLLQEDLKVSAPYITALGAVFMYTYAVSQIFIGLLADKYRGLRVIGAGSAMFAAGSLIFAFSSDIYWLYLSRILMGFGAGCLYLSIVKELECCVSPKNLGLALSAVLFLGYCGGIVANAPFIYCIKAFGYGHTMTAIAFATLLLTLFFIMTGASFRLTEINKTLKFNLEPYREILSDKKNINLFIFGALNYGLFYVIQTVIGKKFLEDFCAMPSEKAAWVLSIMSVISAFSGIFLASLSRVFGGRKAVFFRISAFMTLISFAAVCLLLILDIRNIIPAGLFFILSGAGTMSPLLVMTVNEQNRAEINVTAVGLMNALFFFVVGLLGNAVGFLMNLYSPVIKGNLSVYDNRSYLAVFSVLLLLSMAEVYTAIKQKDDARV